MMLSFGLVLVISLVSSEAEYVTVHTKQGSVQGVVEQSRSGRPFYSFYGIPYAEPPLDERRFANPVPPKPWQGIRNATVWPTPCLSMEEDNKLEGDEDCLYLNLYTPKIADEDDLMPIIVFIFGGALMFGHALPNRYGPHYFMDKDVILITFHYRMDAFGFLSTGDDVIPGNYGLKDMAAVLKWVQEYVEHYKGDKNRVTLMGGSSGGLAAGQALISPLTEGLFHRVISQSANPNVVMKRELARKNAWKIASAVECNRDDVITSQDLVECLRKVPAIELLKARNILYESGIAFGQYPYGPVVEDENVPGAFLIDDPGKLFPRNSNIPWLMGINSEDGGMTAIYIYYTFLFNKSVPQSYEMAENFEHYIPRLVGLHGNVQNSDKLKEIAHKLKTYFFGDTDIRVNSRAFSKMMTVCYFIRRLKEMLRLYRGPTYAYYYAHRNKETFALKYSWGNPTDEMGVIHGDELISMFNWSECITPVTEGVDLVVSEHVLDLWTNFVTNGNPNPENGDKLWKPVHPQSLSYLYIKDYTIVMRSDEELFGSVYDILEYISGLEDSNT